MQGLERNSSLFFQLTPVLGKHLGREHGIDIGDRHLQKLHPSIPQRLASRIVDIKKAGILGRPKGLVAGFINGKLGKSQRLLFPFTLADIGDEKTDIFLAFYDQVIGTGFHRIDKAVPGPVLTFKGFRTVPFKILPFRSDKFRGEIGVDIKDGHGDQFQPAITQSGAGCIVDIEKLALFIHPKHLIHRLIDGKLAKP